MSQNETKRLVDDMMRVMTKKAKAVFVSRLEELVHENYGTRDGAVLDRIAVTDAKAADVEWLQDHLSEAAEEEVARLERFVVGVIAERDHFKAMLRERAEELLAAREEIERLRALYVEARVDGFRDGRRSGAGNKP